MARDLGVPRGHGEVAMSPFLRGVIGAVIGFIGTPVLLMGGAWAYMRITGVRDPGQGIGTLAAFLSFMLCPVEAACGFVVGTWKGRLAGKIGMVIGISALLAAAGFMVWFEMRPPRWQR